MSGTAQRTNGAVASPTGASEVLITFVVPCYNSAGYMRQCIDSLVGTPTSHEILIVNDGSTDDTSRIAHEYAKKYPQVRAIDQENQNWGGVVNTGLRLARGMYFKVVDSDDYIDPEALAVVSETLQALVDDEQPPDLLITNYVYDKVTDGTQHTIHYRKLMPSGRVTDWSSLDKPAIDQFIMIHASWFRTDVVRRSGLVLPTGMSYMDSLFMLHPLPYVETIYYLDVDAYRYRIGREGQSVEVEVVKKHIDEQLMASKLAIDDADYAELFAENPNRTKVMIGYIVCMMSVSTIYLFKINTPEALEKNKRLWRYMEKRNPMLYSHVKKTMAYWANRRTRLGRFLAKRVYGIVQRIFKFA